MSRVAVIGAGVAGLACAHRLAEAGTECDVFERGGALGGQAGTLDVGDGLLIERYPHHLFSGDDEIIGLFSELGLEGELDRHPVDTAIAADGRIWPFNGALDLLRFRPLPPLDRLRTGLGLVRMRLDHDGVEGYEDFTAKDWIDRHMGAPAWDRVWGPVVSGTFGDRADRVSMAWLRERLTRGRRTRRGAARPEAFVHPRRGFGPLFSGLRDRIEAGGGRVMVDTPAARLGRDEGRLAVLPGVAGSYARGLDPREFEPGGPVRSYDAIVCCVPNHVFAKLPDPALAAEVGEPYLRGLEAIECLTALDLLLELDRPLTGHLRVDVADRRVPFAGLIEHPGFAGRQRAAGRVFSHVTNYLPAGHELLELGPDELLDRYEEGLKAVNPSFKRHWVKRRWLFGEPAGQPIIEVGYRGRIPARQTPVRGLLLVNATQIYRQDRALNDAVRNGAAAAADVLDALPALRA